MERFYQREDFSNIALVHEGEGSNVELDMNNIVVDPRLRKPIETLIRSFIKTSRDLIG